LAIGVLVEKYTGLRLVEYKRFRNLLNKIEE
jgi:hypothetical protein